VDGLCIDEQHGVFVSARDGNDDTGEGTRSSPYASITAGLDALRAASAPKRLYVCANGGDYRETVAIEKRHDGVQIFGGLRCEDWTSDALLKAKIAAPDSTAVHVEGLATGLRVEDFEIQAANAVGDGESSFGVIVLESENVVLRRVNVTAGKGAVGADGVAGEAGAAGPSAAERQQGGRASCENPPSPLSGGSWDAESVCGSRGGNGGIAQRGIDGSPGFAGDPRENVTPPNVNNRGAEGATGQDGAPGSPGNPGTPGAATNTAGTFTSDGFTPAPAAGTGTPGFPGQGGGGGGASNATGKSACIGASGGAGGMGGCGGQPGTGGSGGGASVGLLSWNSDVTLEACRISASAGGPGGSGGDGGTPGLGRPGAPGGAGDATNGIGKAGAGGPGGSGGVGGPGAGGNGGPSYGLVYSGTKPAQSGSTMILAGAGGDEGPPGEADEVVGNSGNPGPAAREFAVKVTAP
jgi:hypothetical protein